MVNDERLRAITIEGGRTVYINVLNIRSFQNYESKLIIEMRDGTTYRVDGAPNVNTFYTSTFALSPADVNITTNPVPTSTTITNVPLEINIFTQTMTATQTGTDVSNVSVQIAASNVNRKRLLIRNQDAATGRIFVNFTGGPALTTDLLIAAGETYELPDGVTFTGEIYAISDTAANKPTEVLEWS